MNVRRLTQKERERLEGLRAALGAIADQLSLAQVVALLTVAIEPGLSVNELSERLDMPQQSASRHVAVLLGRYHNSIAPVELEPLMVQEVNPADPRRRALFLSDKGEEIVRQLTASQR